MADPAKVICKIISVKGTCHAGHREGQEFDLSKNFLVGLSGDGKALCPAAFNAAYSYWRVLRYGGVAPRGCMRDGGRSSGIDMQV